MNLAIENHPKIKLRLHIIIGMLVFLNFVLVIARIADKGTPKTRSNTWGIAVAEPRRRALQCLKAAIFLAFQVVTAHVERCKRWASAKAYMILNVIETIFWFALSIITILGTNGAHSRSSRALGGIVATISIIFVLESLVFSLSYVFAVGDTSNNMARFQARLKDHTSDLIDPDANNGSAYDDSQIEAILHAEVG